MISEPNSVVVPDGAAVLAEPFWNEGTLVICAVGLSIGVVWLVWYGGFSALQQAPVRRNRLSPWVPLLILGGWVSLMVGITLGLERAFAGRSAAFREAASYPAMLLLELALIAGMLAAAHRTFARRLKGFGLDLRTAGRDAVFAVVNLAAVYAPVVVLLWAVLAVGSWLNPEFSLQEHQSLTFLDATASLWVRVVTVVFAVLVVPVFEEMLFRGMIQSAVRSHTGSPWAAIVLTSLLFAVLHPMTHAPALLALSCGLGYAYERSGSLLRPIFMHILFNGLSVAATLAG